MNKVLIKESNHMLQEFWTVDLHKLYTVLFVWFHVSEWDCLLNITCNDISVTCIYVTVHRCTGGLRKKFGLQSLRHRYFVGFLNVPVKAPTRGQPFYGYFEKPSHFSRLLRHAWPYGGHVLYSATPPPPYRLSDFKSAKRCSFVHNYIGLFLQWLRMTTIFLLRKRSRDQTVSDDVQMIHGGSGIE